MAKTPGKAKCVRFGEKNKTKQWPSCYISGCSAYFAHPPSPVLASEVRRLGYLAHFSSSLVYLRRQTSPLLRVKHQDFLEIRRCKAKAKVLLYIYIYIYSYM